MCHLGQGAEGELGRLVFWPPWTGPYICFQPIVCAFRTTTSAFCTLYLGRALSDQIYQGPHVQSCLCMSGLIRQWPLPTCTYFHYSPPSLRPQRSARPAAIVQTLHTGCPMHERPSHARQLSRGSIQVLRKQSTHLCPQFAAGSLCHPRSSNGSPPLLPACQPAHRARQPGRPAP